MQWLVDPVAAGIGRVGYHAERAGARRLAQRLFLFAHTLSPHDPCALRFLAWYRRETGDLSGAVAYYQELLELRPSFVAGRVELGFTLGGLERYPEALEQFQRALDHAPQDSAARGGLAAMLLCLRKFADVIPVCEELVREDPADHVVWGFLGRARLDLRQWDDALAAYERAQALHSDPQVAAEHVSVLMELDRYVDAEAVLNAALATHRSDRTLLAELAFVFIEHRRYSDAENVLTRSSGRIR